MLLGSLIIQGSLMSVARADASILPLVGGDTGSSSLVAAIDNLVAGYGEKMTESMLYAPSPSAAYSMAYGQGQDILINKNNNYTIRIPQMPGNDGTVSATTSSSGLNQTAIQSLLTASSSTIGTLQQTLNNAVCASANAASSGGGLFGSMGASVSSALNIGGGGSCGYADTAATFQNYDSNSLLGPVGYPSQASAQIALNYIQYAAGLAQPYSADLAQLQAYNSNNFLPYLTAVRSLNAAQSVGINNLYQIYADRVRIAGLGGKAGLSSDPNAPASVTEVEQYSASRRVTSMDSANSKGWYTQMETASPATIEREMLYILAEMRLEMYKNRQALERLIAVNSVMQLQMTNLSSASGLSALPQLKMQVMPPKRSQ
jgi:hypothetical protein